MAELKFRIGRCVGSVDVLVTLMGTNDIVEYPGETSEHSHTKSKLPRYQKAM